MKPRIKRAFEEFTISIVGDYNFRLMVSQFKGRSIHNYKEAEWIYRYFKKSPRKGVMIDVGAHHGESFAPYQRLGWNIYAFEPDPNNYKRISPHKNLKIYDFAVSDREDDSVPLFSSVESSGISSLAAFRDTHKEIAKVRMTTLRRIIELEQIQMVDYLKVDAEGNDLSCLMGFPFEKITPEVILCEFEDSKSKLFGYTHGELGNFLLEKGYQVLISEWEPIAQYGTRHKWSSVRRFPSKLQEDNAWGNFIALNNIGTLNSMLKSIGSCAQQNVG